MESKARVKTEGQKKGPGRRVSTKLRGGGYADPKAATEKTNKKKTKGKPSEKMKGGGYGDAKGAIGKKKTNTKGGPETTKQPF